MEVEGVPLIELGGFDRVDASRTREQYPVWMDGQRTRGADPLLSSLELGEHDVVLDIGCGTGVDLVALSDKARSAIGIDLSATMAAAAHERAGGRATIAIADGQHLPFPEDTFDACCARAVLVHTPQPALTVAEIARVLRPGGRVVLSEPDQGSHVVATSELDVFERLSHHRRGRFRNPLIGRSLADLAVGAGLTVTTSRAFSIVHRSFVSALKAGGPFGSAVDGAVADGAISEAEAARYVDSLEQLDRRGAFFFAAMAMSVTATR